MNGTNMDFCQNWIQNLHQKEKIRWKHDGFSKIRKAYLYFVESWNCNLNLQIGPQFWNVVHNFEPFSPTHPTSFEIKTSTEGKLTLPFLWCNFEFMVPHVESYMGLSPINIEFWNPVSRSWMVSFPSPSQRTVLWSWCGERWCLWALSHVIDSLCICISVFVCLCICVFMHLCVCVFVCLCVCIWVQRTVPSDGGVMMFVSNCYHMCQTLFA